MNKSSWVPWAANHHKLEARNNGNSSSRTSGDRKSELRCGQGWSSWKLTGENHPCPTWLLAPAADPGTPGLVDTSLQYLPPSSHGLRVSVSESSLLSLTRTPVIRFRDHQKSKTISSPKPYWIWRPYFQVRSHPEFPSEHGFGGTLFSPLHQTNEQST